MFKSPSAEFEKAAIKEVLVTIPIDCRVYRLLHFLIKNQKEFIALGMEPWDFYDKDPSLSSSSSNKENENKKMAKKQRSQKRKSSCDATCTSGRAAKRILHVRSEANDYSIGPSYGLADDEE